jgi:hypothetical protein
MNLNLLSESVLETKISDGQYADHYRLSSTTEFWNSAFIAIISKSFIKNQEIAFINFAGLIAMDGDLTHEIEANVTIKEFILFLQADYYLPHLEGQQISIQIFWDNFFAIYNGIIEDPNSTCNKNGVKISFDIPFIKEDVLNIIAFDDRWNQKMYFIEMHNSWGVFYWYTAA